MSRSAWLLALALLIPGESAALQLRWSTGASDVVATTATRCTLVVQADSSEGGGLPAEWRLLWVADSLSVQFVSEDTSLACAEDEARTSTIDGPASSGDLAANLITAHFCSDGSSSALVARHIVDLPANGRGRFKAIALDPDDPDSSLVIESNEATYNGGIDGEYAPTVLNVWSEHQSLQLKVTAVGSGLGVASAMSLQATDASWSLPLAITSQSNASLTGVASVAALLPESHAVVGTSSGTASMAPLEADDEPSSEDLLSCSAQYNEALLFPAPPFLPFTIQPKDFAFAKGFVDATSNRFALHLFYIRHNYWYQPFESDLDEKNLGHIWTTDFNSWYGPGGLNQPDTTALVVRQGKFDELHVWAPTIVQKGPVFHMFYTGVRKEQGKPHQRIGVATSTDLMTWTPEDDVVLSAPQISWADKDPTGTVYSGAQQLRDPFVMEDPTDPERWLMYFVALDSCDTPDCVPKMAVGVARSPDLREWTATADPFISTQQSVGIVVPKVVESPHVFRRNGQWWMPYTIEGTTVVFENSTGADPADTSPAAWSDPVVLRSVVEGEPAPLLYWHATEYLRINSKEYLAAFNDASVSIDIRGMFPAASPAVDSMLLSCPEVADAGPEVLMGTAARLSVQQRPAGTPGAILVLQLQTRMAVRLTLHDIAGRRIATVLDGVTDAGATEVVWDGMSDDGTQTANGVYFARLIHPHGAETSKLLVLR